MKKVASSLFKLVVFTMFQVSTVFAQYSYNDFQNETDAYRKSEIALELVEYFTRKDVDSFFNENRCTKVTKIHRIYCFSSD